MIDFGIVEMHYYFDEQLKIADNNLYQELDIPQKDFLLNVAEETYVKMIAFPLYSPALKFEITDRTRNNIQSIIVNSDQVETVFERKDSSYLYKLPADCRYFLGGTAVANNGSCYKEIELFPVLHDNVSKADYTIRSSFLWEEINYRFISEGILLEADDSFAITGVKPVYIKRTPYMHRAQDYKGGTYKKLDGTTLVGRQDSMLPKNALLDIVHIAVLLLKADLGMSVDGQMLKLREIN